MKSYPCQRTALKLFLGLLCLALVAGAFSRPTALSGAPSPDPHRWALLVGVSDYQDREVAGPATGAADSRELAKALGAAGWGRVVRLADDLSRREVDAARAALRQLAPARGLPAPDDLKATDLSPTRAHVSAWIEAVVGKDGGLGESDALLVAFSGRCAVATDGSACLLARDTRLSDPAETGIRVSTLRDQLAATTAGTRILILDTCRPGDPGLDRKGPAQALLDDARSPGIALFAACSAGQVSYPLEAPGKGGSAFAHFMAEGLRGQADGDRSGTVSAAELRDYVAAQVAGCSRGRQTPVLAGSEEMALACAVEAPAKGKSPRVGLIAGGLAAVGGLVAALAGGGGGGGSAAQPAATVRGYVFQSSSRAVRMAGRQNAGYLLLRAGGTPPEGSTPAAGATVRAASGASTTTSGSGEFALGVNDAECTLTASLSGYDSVSATIATGGGGGSAPAMVSAWAVDATHVDVVFSKLLDPASATTAANYSVTPSLAVASARLQPNGTTVRLATAEQSRGTGYAVTATGVSDGQGHAIAAPVSSASFTGEGDPPQVVVALVPEDTQVDVVFNEAVDPQTAGNPANYSISPALAVSAATVQADGKTVRLTTAYQRTGLSYTVAVTGVRDVAGNAIGSANQMATFSGKGSAPQVVSATALDGTHVSILFNKALQGASVPLVSNYTISPALAVQEAALQSDGLTILLTTAEQAGQITYTVTVAGVTDVPGNPVGAEHNSATFTGRVLMPRVVSATALDSVTVQVAFNVAMDPSTLGGYSITSGDGAAVAVASSAVPSDHKSVRLTTSEHTGGATYTVTVGQGKDPYGNDIPGGSAAATYTGIGVPPRVVSASARDLTHVVLIFSEALDRPSAETVSNYVVSPALPITSAALQAGGNSVFLTTAEQQAGTQYTLTAAGVKDRVFNTVDGSGNSALFTGSSAPTARNGRIVFEGSGVSAPQGINAIGGDGSAMSNLRGAGSRPVPSPDGSRIAFEVNSSDIWVMGADGTAAVQLTTSSDVEIQPTWSPDGARIAYHRLRDANDEIWVMNADGTGQALLTTGPRDTRPVWSPDGSRIAFQSGAYSSQRGNDHIYVVNRDGTGRVCASQPSTTSSEYAPAWSPDGARIAFRSWDAGGMHIGVANADGSGRALLTACSVISPSNISGRTYDRMIAWSPDGTRLLFVDWEATGSADEHLWVIDADGTNRRRLTDRDVSGPGNTGPCWSPDGSAICWQGAMAAIWVMNADGSGQARIAGGGSPCWGREASLSTLTPRVAAAVSRHPWRAEVFFDVAMEKASAEAAGNYTIAPSLAVTGAVLQADGKSVLLTTADQQEGQQYTVVATGVKDAAGNPVASPAGSATFTGRGFHPGANLLAYSVATDGLGGTAIRLSCEDGSWPMQLTSDGTQPTWSPDGMRLAFMSNRHGDEGLCIINADGTGRVNLTQKNGISGNSPAWSPDGRRIALAGLAGGTGGIWVMDPDGGNPTCLVSDPLPGWSGGILWSPDGSKVVWESADHKINVVNADGSGLHTISASDANDTSPAWSPDSRRIAYAHRPVATMGYVYYSIRVAAAADGAVQAEIKDIAGAFSSDPVLMPLAWSPDGRKISFSRPGPGSYYHLSLVNADGTGAIADSALSVDRLSIRRPAWSPDSAYIAYLGRYGLRTLRADLTSSVEISSNTAAGGFAWRPVAAGRAAAVARAARVTRSACLRAACGGELATARLAAEGLVPDGRAAGLRFLPLEGTAPGLRSPVSGRSWTFALEAPSPGAEVTLSWPDLSALGRDRVTLEDLDAGARRSMRTTAAYTFRAGEGGRRRFRVSAVPRTGPAVAITGLELAGARGGRIARFTLSADATVDLRVLDASGREVATLARSRACTAGLNQVGWTATLPSGLCLLQATATTEEGTTIRAIRPVMSIR